MENKESMNRTVSYGEELEALLQRAYPGAKSIPEAIIWAAQDGAFYRLTGCDRVPEEDVRAIVREIVREELEEYGDD